MRLFSIVFSVVMALALTGCSKKDKGGCTPTSATEDDAKMQAYITANGVTATKDASGMYYQIIDPGTGTAPTVSSVVVVKYAGKLTNNTVFDSNNSLEYPLNRLILGWQIGIPKIKKGGKIKLIIPPSLAYGCDDIKDGNTVVLPGNSVLVFDVELLDVK
ncbi:FKBP-type peptidylprolyl isomerase [Paraflavitalea soli]|uniref:Peptidyl-prolyl cis-trans isomerase n=1 Tax=Paraflavitalea soli TaxID=2315862 RepID=A0A3B7MX40_9BACT|nr:FKBP-type peptidyl-prolyl cis-trans isomerase [Paraflavitalea soli]AXY74931.1 FKBP-type peptidylprolyl isomerase [Paraflavitalea soli]